jgi:hypothetical protein
LETITYKESVRLSRFLHRLTEAYLRKAGFKTLEPIHPPDEN